MNNILSKEFLSESKLRFESSFRRLYHCLDKLDETQIGWRPDENMNSIGILITHVCGSFRQWTITPINNEDDERHRPDEFVNDSKFTKEVLLNLTSNLKSDFLSAIDILDPSRLTEQRRVQGYDVTLMSAIFRALTHLEGHTGQVVLLTRMQLGDRYEIFWKPQNDEQRSERKRKL